MKQRKAARKTGRKPRVAKAKAAAPKRATTRPLALPAECAIASAQSLRKSLMKRLSDRANVQIDASAVQRIDTASLQVLAAFARDRRAAGLEVEWLGVPASLTDVARMLDLTNVLGFDAQAVA
jgi:ABC-type transporter Mla MlaB component